MSRLRPEQVIGVEIGSCLYAVAHLDQACRHSQFSLFAVFFLRHGIYSQGAMDSFFIGERDACFALDWHIDVLVVGEHGGLCHVGALPWCVRLVDEVPEIVRYEIGEVAMCVRGVEYVGDQPVGAAFL